VSNIGHFDNDISAADGTDGAEALMEGLQVVKSESVVGEIGFSASATSNYDIITLEHMKADFSAIVLLVLFYLQLLLPTACRGCGRRPTSSISTSLTSCPTSSSARSFWATPATSTTTWPGFMASRASMWRASSRRWTASCSPTVEPPGLGAGL